MGEVWAATTEDGQQQVAVKVLLPRAALKPELVRRFEREAKVAASIQSPFVCQLHSIEREAGVHLLVFEKLEGESLAERLKRELYLPFAEVGPIVDDVLQGLVAAHVAGVIHRDLKPGNIFLERTDDSLGDYGTVERGKILDFGISKLTKKDDGDEPSLTDFDATLGSFAYMAPEQMRGAARVDERADIYAVGAVAFRALAGRLPFEAVNAGMLMALKLNKAAPSLSEVTGDRWPAGLEAFIACALQRDREQRFASAGAALQQWRDIQPEALSRRSALSRPPDLAQADEAATVADTADTSDTSIDGAPTVTDVSNDDNWDHAPTEVSVDSYLDDDPSKESNE